MTCERSQWQLNALADGALPPMQARQVRRHLAHCRDCAAAYAQIVQLGADARTWHDAAPPAALAARIASALPPQTRQRENPAIILERPLPIADPLRRVGPRRARIALALAACLAAMLTLALWPGRQATLPATYADTVAAMQRVHSAAWTVTTTVTKPNGSIGFRQVEQTWVRRNPPALATSAQTNPSTHGGIYRTLKNARGSWSMGTEEGVFQSVLSHTHGAKQLEAITARIPIDRQVWWALDSIIPAGTRKISFMSRMKQEQAMQDGRTLICFRHDSPLRYPAQPNALIQGPVASHVMLWVDPQTHRVERSEWEFAGPKMGRFSSTRDHIVYDQPAPAGVFDEAAYPASSHTNAASAPAPQSASPHAAPTKP